MKSIEELLDTRKETILFWKEPWKGCDQDGLPVDAHVRLSATVDDCIKMERLKWRESKRKLPITVTDEELLIQFMAVNWAEEQPTTKTP